MHNIQSVIDNTRQSWEAAQRFADTYAHKLPENLPCGLSLYGANPMFGIYTKQAYAFMRQEDRERILATIGEIFGREGWIRNINYDRNGFDWRKNVEGVLVVIGDAETMNDPRDGTPVLPAAFPILLPEVATPTE